MSFWDYLRDNRERLTTSTIEHAEIVLISIGFAVIIGVGLGVLTYRTNAARQVALAVTGTFLTIPSIALFGFMLTIFGLGATTAIIGLVMYALLPIVRNTIAGLREVDPAIVESATGMGLPGWRRLIQIELPLAWPVILTGIRVSAQILVGIAAIAAIINGPGLGKDIFRALARIGTPTAVNQAVAAIACIVLLGLLLDLAFIVLGKLTTARGIRD